MPAPCPLCGRTDGTYQYVVFNNERRWGSDVICRIGHYDSNRYDSTRRALKSKITEPRVKWRSGRIWHSFTALAPFGIIVEDKTVSPGQYFVEFPEEKWWKASKTFKQEAWMSDRIRELGWRMVPEKNLSLARRKPKEFPKNIET